MNWLANIIRPDLRAFAAYRSARTETSGAFVGVVLDANENPWPPFGFRAIESVSNRYPEPQPVELRRRLAMLNGIAPERLLIGRGSDEGIDLLIRLLCRAGEDEVIICPPTYGMYEVSARLQGAAVKEIPLRSEDDWQLDVPMILAACTDRTKLIFIPSPNAPMGHLMRRNDILRLCEERAGRSLIVVDEAYVEFTESPKGFAPTLEEQPNLVLLRTLSKAYALAGERIGLVFGAPELIGALRKIQAPYSLTQSSIRVALDALGPNGLIQNRERCRLLVAERKRLERLLHQANEVKKIFPSVTNFLLMEVRDPVKLMADFTRLGIRIRNRSKEIPNAVRLSVGTPEDNNLVLEAFGVFLPEGEKKRSPRFAGLHRTTKETRIDLVVNLEEPAFLQIETGIGFFDHMLCQIAQHGGFGLALRCEGDLAVDRHHTIEDCALALGEALHKALGNKRGLARFGFTAPLDESLARVAVDFSGRPHCSFEGRFPANKAGDMDSEMVPHFFRSLATALGASIHMEVRGDNTHHMIEACFKAFGRALRDAFKREGDTLPSTKGVL